MRTILTTLLTLWALAATLAFAFQPEEPACLISLDKLNEVYIGVDNPASILVCGVPEAEIQIETSENLSIKKGSGLRYTVRANTPGQGSITVSGGKLKPVKFLYQARRFPDPVPRLGAMYGSGTINSAVFKAQGGVAALLENLGFDAKCDVISYKVVHMRNCRFFAEATNSGARFEPGTRVLIDDALPGDTYIFEEIKVRCPGDKATRTLNHLSFLIR